MTELTAPPTPVFPRRRLRWAAPPLAAGVLLAGFGLAPSLAGTSAPPALPAVTAQDLVAKALGADSIAGFTGTVQTQTDLGLPSLGSALGPANGNLLTYPYTYKSANPDLYTDKYKYTHRHAYRHAHQNANPFAYPLRH